MYKMVIADDEMWVRKGIIEQIAWEKFNLKLIGEAVNGEDAFQMVRNKGADILLTDIKMPLTDGLQLSKNLIDVMPDLKIIIFSGYSEYELIRQAMTHKAIDYILKPVDKDELNHAINKAVIEIRKDRLLQAEYSSIRSLLEKSLPALREKCFFDLLFRDISFDSEASEMINILDAQFIFQGFIVFIANIVCKTSTAKNNVKGIFDRLIAGLGPSIYFGNPKDSSEFIVITQAPEQDDASIADSLTGNKTILESENDIKILLGIGRRYHKWSHISSSYSEAIYALRSTSQLKDGITFYSDSRKKKTVLEDIEKICDYIKENYYKPLTLESVSDYFFVNPSYLSREFKNSTNENFIDFLTRIRIENALNLIKKTDLQINQISQMVGFQNANYFSRLFKKKMGISPISFQQKLK